MTRPLQGLIETMREYEGGPDPMIYWTKGHVDKAEFAAEVRVYCAEIQGTEWWDRFPYGAEHVEHTYYRNVPVGRGYPGEMLMYPCDGPGRGAYPVTAIDIDRACNNSSPARTRSATWSAGALIAAELDRLLRQQARDEKDDEIPGLCTNCGRMAEVLEGADGSPVCVCGRCGDEWPCEEAAHD